jgi:hypothetical protein
VKVTGVSTTKVNGAYRVAVSPTVIGTPTVPVDGLATVETDGVHEPTTMGVGSSSLEPGGS